MYSFAFLPSSVSSRTRSRSMLPVAIYCDPKSSAKRAARVG